MGVATRGRSGGWSRCGIALWHGRLWLLLVVLGCMTGCAAARPAASMSELLHANTLARAELYLERAQTGELCALGYAKAVFTPENKLPDVEYVEVDHQFIPLVKRVALSPEEVQEAKQWLDQVLHITGAGVTLCHMPHHYLELVYTAEDKDEWRLSVSVCFQCENFVVTTPGIQASGSFGNAGTAIHARWDAILAR